MTFHLIVFSLALAALTEAKHIPYSSRTMPKYENTSSSLESDLKWVVPMTGYYENVYYKYTDCTQAQEKHVVALNQCAPTWEYPNAYANLSVNANPDWNTYYVTINYYSDSQCTQTLNADQFKQGILICTGTTYGGGVLTHAISEPLYPQYDNLDYTIGIYDSQTNCQGNGFTGLLDIEYVRFGECTAYNGYDLIINSCTSSGLVGFTYSSQDFSCSGTATAVTITAASDTCTSNTNNIVGLFQGYSNFVCAPGSNKH